MIHACNIFYNFYKSPKLGFTENALWSWETKFEESNRIFEPYLFGFIFTYSSWNYFDDFIEIFQCHQIIFISQDPELWAKNEIWSQNRVTFWSIDLFVWGLFTEHCEQQTIDLSVEFIHTESMQEKLSILKVKWSLTSKLTFD